MVADSIAEAEQLFAAVFRDELSRRRRRRRDKLVAVTQLWRTPGFFFGEDDDR